MFYSIRLTGLPQSKCISLRMPMDDTIRIKHGAHNLVCNYALNYVVLRQKLGLTNYSYATTVKSLWIWCLNLSATRQAPNFTTYSNTKWRFRLISFTNFNAQFLYSLTICMLHYNSRHVSSINMPIFRRTNCIITASGIVTLCKRLYSMLDESRLPSGILYSRLQRVTIPDAVIIQFVLLKMGMLMLETCRGL
jgi:hypothetical protein